MIKTENSKQSKVSFNSDFQGLLKMVKEDNSFSEDVADLILNLIKDAELNYQNSYNKPFGSSIIFWNRFTNDIDLMSSNDVDDDYFSLKDPNGVDLLSYFPIFSFNYGLLRQKSLKKTLKLDKEIALIHYSDFKGKENEFSEFLKNKIQSKLLKDQKIFLEVKSGNYDSIYNKFQKGELYPIDLFPIDLQKELYWSKLYPFNLSKDFSNDSSKLINFFGSNNEWVTGENSRILDKDYKLRFPFSLFEKELTSFAIEAFNESDSYSFTAKLDLSKFLSNLQTRDAQDLIKNSSINFKINKDFITSETEKFVNDLRESIVNSTYEKRFSGTPFDLINDKSSELNEIINSMIESFFESIKNKPICFYNLDFSIQKLIRKNNIKITEFYNSLLYLKDELEAREAFIFSPISHRYGELRMIETRISMDEPDSFCNSEKLLQLLKENNCKTTSYIRDQVDFLLNSELFNFSENEIKTLKIVFELELAN